MSTEYIRPMLIVALCFVLLLMWQAWQQDYGKGPAETETLQQGESTIKQDVPQAPRVSNQNSPSGNNDTPVGQGRAIAKPPATEVATSTMLAEIDENGTLSRVRLRQYKVDVDSDELFTLMSSLPPSVFTAQSGLISEQGAPNHHAQFAPTRPQYILSDNQGGLEVTMEWLDPEDTGVKITKFYRFRRDSYLVEVGYHIVNDTQEPWSGRLYGQFRRNPDESSQPGLLGGVYTYTGGVISSPEKPYEKVDFGDMEEESLNRSVKGGWVAMIQHYFVGAWVPDPDATMNFYTKALGDGNYVMGMIAPLETIAAGASQEVKFKLFVGPKIQERLAQAAPGLDRTVDYGWLFFIAQPLYICLQFIQGVVFNWGWSIIILTIFIKLLFFPLSNASYKSMARMRKLQPKMMSLRERYGDDKQKLNQGMMEMYRKEKINPLGGCLPILVQIPVFIALYWVLLETVELRQAPFMLWLRDLSAHDPYYVLPVLMGISMFAQQRLNPTPPDPIQAKVMMALPVVFTFFFLFFPSGLVLYWFVNNLLSIAQQWVITRRIERASSS